MLYLIPGGGSVYPPPSLCGRWRLISHAEWTCIRDLWEQVLDWNIPSLLLSPGCDLDKLFPCAESKSTKHHPENEKHWILWMCEWSGSKFINNGIGSGTLASDSAVLQSAETPMMTPSGSVLMAEDKPEMAFLLQDFHVIRQGTVDFIAASSSSVHRRLFQRALFFLMNRQLKMGRKFLLCGQDVYDSQVMAFLGSIQLHFIPSWNALGITCVFPISNTYHGDQDSALGWLLPWGEQVTVIDSRPDFVQSDLNTLSQIWQPWLDILHCQKKTQSLDFVVIERENQERAMVPTCMIWIPESQPVLGVIDQFKKNLRVPLAPSIIEMNFRRRKSDSLPTPPQDWFPSDPPDKFLMPSLFAQPLRPVTNLKVGEEQASKPTASVSQLDTKLAKTKRPTRKTKSTISSPTKVRLKYEHEEVTEDDFQFFDANGNGCMAAPQIRKLIPNDTLPAEFRPLKDIRLDWGHYKEGGLYNYEPRTESLVDKTEPPAVSVETRIPTWQKFEPAGVMDIDESTDTFEANEHDNATEQQLQTKNKQVTDLKDDDKSSQFEHVVFQGPHDLICVDPGDLRSEHPSTGSSEASTSFNWYRLQLIHKSLNQCRLKLAHRTLYQILRSQLKMQLKLFSLSDKTCEILDAPQAIVLNQRRHEWYAEIAALNHWQELGFFPWAGPKNVAAISFQFKNNDSVDSMFRQLGMVYSALNLGSYRLKKIHLDIEIGERILRNPNVMIKSLLNRYDETRSLLNLDADTHLIVFIVDPLGEKVGATFWPDVIEGFRQRLNMQYLPVFLLKQSDCTVRNILDCKTAMKLYSSIDMHTIKPLRVDLFPELQGVVKEKYVSAPLWILKDRYPTSPVIFTQETRIASVFIHSSKIDGSLVVEILETSGRFRKTLVVSQNEPNPILFLYRYLRKYLPSCYQWEIIWVLNRPLNDGASIIIPWQTESKNTHAKHITPRQSLLIRPKSCILDYCTYEKSSPPSKNWKAFVTSDRNEFPLTVSLSPVAYGVLVLESSNIYEEYALVAQSGIKESPSENLSKILHILHDRLFLPESAFQNWINND